MENVAAVNRNIMARIEEMGLKRKQVADQAGIDVSYFYKMVGGQQRWQLEYLEATAKVLGVPLWRLFYEGPELVKSESPDLLLGPDGREFMAASSEEYVRLPVIKLQVAIQAPDEPEPGPAAWIMLAKKSLLEGLAMGRTPAAVELGLRVKY